MLANIYNHFAACNASIIDKFNKLSGNTLRSQSARTETPARYFDKKVGSAQIVVTF